MIVSDKHVNRFHASLHRQGQPPPDTCPIYSARFDLKLTAEYLSALTHRGEPDPSASLNRQTDTIICDFHAQPAIERHANATGLRIRMSGDIRQRLQRDVIGCDLDGSR